MEELQRRPGESAEEWLTRLKEIGPDTLSEADRRTWELAVGYARHLMGKGGGQDGGQPPPAPP